MRCWCVAAIGCVLLLGADRATRKAEPVKPPQYQIKLSLRQGDPLGSREEGTLKILAEPTLITMDGREATFVSGGQIYVENEFVGAGLKVSVTPMQADQRIKLRLTLERTEVVEEREDTLLLQSSQARYIRVVEPGQVLKLRWGKSSVPQTWVELSARELPADR
jgi:hypothetical protein